MTTLLALMREQEAAELMKVSIRTLQGWRVTGGGPAFTKIGRAVRYDRNTIETWLRSRERSSTSATGVGEFHTR